MGSQHRLLEIVVVLSDRGMELLLRRRFHMAAEIGALNGSVLHHVVLHLVVQVGIRYLRVFTRADRAVLDNTPEQHEADQYKDPEHDRFDGRIHQDPLSRRGEAA